VCAQHGEDALGVVRALGLDAVAHASAVSGRQIRDGEVGGFIEAVQVDAER